MADGSDKVSVMNRDLHFKWNDGGAQEGVAWRG
jgi:hypothetical protein